MHSRYFTANITQYCTKITTKKVKLRHASHSPKAPIPRPDGRAMGVFRELYGGRWPRYIVSALYCFCSIWWRLKHIKWITCSNHPPTHSLCLERPLTGVYTPIAIILIGSALRTNDSTKSIIRQTKLFKRTEVYNHFHFQVVFSFFVWVRKTIPWWGGGGGGGTDYGDCSYRARTTSLG